MIAGYVEDVIDDLKSQTDRAGVGIQLRQYGFTTAAGVAGGECHTGAKQRTGLQAVHLLQRLQIELFADAGGDAASAAAYRQALVELISDNDQLLVDTKSHLNAAHSDARSADRGRRAVKAYQSHLP